MPKKTNFRFEGDCPECAAKFALYSYTLKNPDYDCPPPAEAGREYCGYYCESCDFSNAGTRKIAANE